jgi:hypothetical protein
MRSKKFKRFVTEHGLFTLAVILLIVVVIWLIRWENRETPPTIPIDDSHYLNTLQ